MSDDILISISRDPLFGMTREDYISKLQNRLQGRVDEGFFFGSFTGADFNKFSDIDIILVAETGKPFHLRSLDFADILDLVPSTDILVYTRSELDTMLSSADTGFWKSVKESMVRFI